MKPLPKGLCPWFLHSQHLLDAQHPLQRHFVISSMTVMSSYLSSQMRVYHSLMPSWFVHSRFFLSRTLPCMSPLSGLRAHLASSATHPQHSAGFSCSVSENMMISLHGSCPFPRVGDLDAKATNERGDQNKARRLQHLQPKISSKRAALYNNNHDWNLTVCQNC